MIAALTQHAPEYLIEGALLGLFMIAACAFGTLLEHPDGFLANRLRSPAQRRVLMGLAMGAVAVALIYSPWGQRSGAHMNPAVTLTFALRGKVAAWDAVFYVLAQFVGGAAGVVLARGTIGRRLAAPQVQFVVTAPGARGAAIAWIAEFVISAGMMLTILVVANDAQLAPLTGWFAGGLVAAYIAIEAPLSGMSMNPARTFASALVARRWTAYWVYFTAPLIGMLSAAFLYATLPGEREIFCAKLNHTGESRCIFRCAFERLYAAQRSDSTAGPPRP